MKKIDLVCGLAAGLGASWLILALSGKRMPGLSGIEQQPRHEFRKDPSEPTEEENKFKKAVLDLRSDLYLYEELLDDHRQARLDYDDVEEYKDKTAEYKYELERIYEDIDELERMYVMPWHRLVDLAENYRQRPAKADLLNTIRDKMKKYNLRYVWVSSYQNPNDHSDYDIVLDKAVMNNPYRTQFSSYGDIPLENTLDENFSKSYARRKAMALETRRLALNERVLPSEDDRVSVVRKPGMKKLPAVRTRDFHLTRDEWLEIHPVLMEVDSTMYFDVLNDYMYEKRQLQYTNEEIGQEVANWKNRWKPALERHFKNGEDINKAIMEETRKYIASRKRKA